MESNRHNPLDIDNAPIERILRSLEGQLLVLSVEGIESQLWWGQWDEEEAEYHDCDACHGMGSVDLFTGDCDYYTTIDCPECGGSGEVESDKVVQVNEWELTTNIFI